MVNHQTDTETEKRHRYLKCPKASPIKKADPQLLTRSQAELRGMASLESVLLWNTNVTPEGVKKLQEALPNCKIEY